MNWLDLNADLGEGTGADAQMLAIVSSASIACGGHAGDADTMRAALLAARAHGVVAGFHPGFVDREHFGRRRLDIEPETLARDLREQLETLGGIADEIGVAPRYLKLHGALANMAAEDAVVARIAFTVARAFDPELAILAIDGSEQVRVAEALDLEIVAEAYADRGYRPDGLLVARSEPGAMLHDPELIAERALRLAEAGEIVAVDGTVLRTGARSLCVHGDNPAALAIARHLRETLAAAGIAVRAAL